MASKLVIDDLESAVAKVRRAVEEDGAYLMAVPEDTEARRPDYVYTVGLTEKGLPELVVFGLQQPTADLLLRPLFERMHAGEILQRGERMTVGPFTLVLHDVPTAVAIQYMGLLDVLYDEREISCIQVVWADPHGRFPWESGFGDLKLQPVLSRH